MYGDYTFDLSSKIRIASSYIFSPFTQIEYLAKDSFNSFDSYFSSQKKLSEEIVILRNQIRDLENQNLVLQNTKTSLNELEELFDLSTSFQERKIFLGKITDFKKFPKEIVSVETRSNNITKDMIAFNAFGLIGVIDELLNNSIKIIPLHNPSIKIPAKNSRTIENIIIVGTGKPKTFQIEEFKKNGDIKKGDEIISSGLGGRFPEGFLLGRVTEIKENDQSNFLQITVENTFDFSFGSTILFTKP
jgi:rod shape-determining protein MreC